MMPAPTNMNTPAIFFRPSVFGVFSNCSQFCAFPPKIHPLSSDSMKPPIEWVCVGWVKKVNEFEWRSELKEPIRSINQFENLNWHSKSQTITTTSYKQACRLSISRTHISHPSPLNFIAPINTYFHESQELPTLPHRSTVNPFANQYRIHFDQIIHQLLPIHNLLPPRIPNVMNPI